MDVEEQYEEMLKLVDAFKQAGLIYSDIGRSWWRRAIAFYGYTIEGLGGVT